MNWLWKGQELPKEGLDVRRFGSPGAVCGCHSGLGRGEGGPRWDNPPAASVVSSLRPLGHMGPPASKMQPLLPFQDGK